MTFHYLIICDKCGAKFEVPILPGFVGVNSDQIVPDSYDSKAREQRHICRECLQKEETEQWSTLGQGLTPLSTPVLAPRKPATTKTERTGPVDLEQQLNQLLVEPFKNKKRQ